jgi:hypothetical protein
VLIWAHDKGGFIPDDVPWADPFARMRLEEDKPEREPFDTSELQTMLRRPYSRTENDRRLDAATLLIGFLCSRFLRDAGVASLQGLQLPT